jgi:hypothetical protein
MGKINIDGIDIEIAGDEINKQEFDFIKNLKSATAGNPSGVSNSEIDPNTGYYNLPEVGSKVRFAVSAAPNLQSKFKTLQKFYKEVRQDEYDPENFIVTDNDGKKFILDDKSKSNLKDVIDVGKDITQVVTSTAGAVAGSAAGPLGTIAGSGAGLAGGSEIYERFGQLAGTEIDRTAGEYAKTRLGEVALGSVAQAAGPLLLKGTKYLFRGTESNIYKEAAGKLGVPENEAKAAYDALSLTDKVDKGLNLNMADKLTLFEKYNVKPTIGQVTENKVIDTLSITYANVPFAAPILRGIAEKAQNELGESFTATLAKSLELPSKEITKEITGDVAAGVIQRGLIKKAKDISNLGDTRYGITNKSGFFERFKNTNTINYGAVDEAIGKNAKLNVPLTNYTNFLKTEIGSDATKLTKQLDDPKILKLYEDVVEKQLASGGVVPYAAARALRSKIGQRLGNPLIIDTTPRNTYKAMYANLSKDIQSAVGGMADNGKALRLMQKADSYYNTNITLIDDVLNNIAAKVDPDSLIQQLFTKGKTGATAINNIMKGLQPDEKKIVVAAIVNKLGQGPVTGELGSLGKTNFFNTSVFNKNYGSMEESAKKAFFSNYKELGQGLKEVNKISTIIEIQNPFKDLGQAATKGTAGTGLIVGAGSQAVLAGISAGAVASGNPLFLLGIPLFGYGGAYALKAMSNPAFLKWLSEGTKIAGNKGFDGVAEHLIKLGTIAGNSDDDMGQLTNQYMEMIKKSSQNYEKNEAEKNISKALNGAEQTKNAQASVKQDSVKQAPPMGPVNTRVTNIDQSTQPMDKAQKYAGLFPFDIAGQQIARRG